MRECGTELRVSRSLTGTPLLRWRQGCGCELDPGDVLVMGEVGRWDFLTKGKPVVILCQGVDFVFASSDFLVDEPGAYPAWPSATSAIATSESIRAFLTAACPGDFPIHHVPLEIEGYFKPGVKRRQIALMPRRRREDLLATVHLLRRSGMLTDWEIVLIDGMSQADVASVLGSSAIFLFGGEREGFGLPGAEAMASGCYVIGFTGDGAKEYMLPEHSSPVPESDCVEAAQQTLRAMRWFTEDRTTWDERTGAAMRFIERKYNADRSREGLASAFAEILAPGSRSVFDETVVLCHYQAHAPAVDLWNRTRVASRRTAQRALERAQALRAGRDS